MIVNKQWVITTVLMVTLGMTIGRMAHGTGIAASSAELMKQLHRYEQNGWPVMELKDWLVLVQREDITHAALWKFVKAAHRHPTQSGIDAYGDNWISFRGRFRMVIQGKNGRRHVVVTNLNEKGIRMGGPVSEKERELAARYWEKRREEYRRFLEERRARHEARRVKTPSRKAREWQEHTYYFPNPFVLLLCGRPGFGCTGIDSHPRTTGPHGFVPNARPLDVPSPTHRQPRGRWPSRSP